MAHSISFHGAARTVTGSCHMLNLQNRRILVDCGMFQGSAEERERNREDFPFDPAQIRAVILTHAHADHIGRLPRLVRMGFDGPVYATKSTIGICKISLPDSARLLEEDARYEVKKGLAETADPLYTEADVKRTLKLMQEVHFYRWTDLPGGAAFRFLPAGHILGSAFAEIALETGDRVLMSGDLGRWDRPILKDPTTIDSTEHLVMESTYGDRFHAQEDTAAALEEVILDAVQRRRVILVPSFAIGRTQELLWHLHQLIQAGRIPRIPIHVDSPMANATTLLYDRPREDMDPELRLDLTEGNSPFDSDMVHFVRARHESKALNEMEGPRLIISGSGMATGGRIVHHLAQRLGDPSTVVLFTGFQARGTLGRRLIEKEPEVRILGREFTVRAEIRKLNSLSAHADQGEMMEWLRRFARPPKRVYLVHGEPPAQEALAGRIREELGWTVEIPEEGQSFSLD